MIKEDDPLKYLSDFAKSHANIGFSNLGLCEVDNVIFSRLSYLDFSAHIKKSIKEAAEDFTYTPESETTRQNKNIVRSEELLRLLGTTERYKNIRISDFTELSGNSETAFSATVFGLNNGTSYIAYRGTDDKITGIYEDAELAYSFPIPGQLAALSYTNKILKSESTEFFLGGHSKGGNFALFSYIFLNEKSRIIRVYNNDGPGFPKELAKILFTKENCAKIINLAPEDSIVGRMLEDGGKYVIVKSSAIGAGQHNVFTWITNGEKFERAEKFSAISEYVEQTLSESLETISPVDMRKAAESIYEIAVKSGIESTKDINRKSYSSILQSLIQILKSEDNAADEFSVIIKTLIRNLLDSEDIEKYISDRLSENIPEIGDGSEIRKQIIEFLQRNGKNKESNKK